MKLREEIGCSIMEAKRILSKERKVEVLQMIADDMKNDAKEFDGKPFNGRTVAEYFGNQGAAIAALARVVQSMLKEGN